jgi:hypothetical protein
MSYYGLGTEEAILLSLYTAASGITGIKFVDYQRIQASGVNPELYPGVFINSLRTDKKKLLKNVFKNTFGVALVCWVWATAEGTLGTQMNAFFELVKTALLADTNRNSNAYETLIQSVATDGGSRYPQGMAVVSLTITYFSRN